MARLRSLVMEALRSLPPCQGLGRGGFGAIPPAFWRVGPEYWAEVLLTEQEREVSLAAETPFPSLRRER